MVIKMGCHKPKTLCETLFGPKNYLEELITDLCAAAYKEEWETVDGRVKEISLYNSEKVFKKLQERALFVLTDGNQRDLAYTIVAELDVKSLSKASRTELNKAVRDGVKDPWIYARFRASIAAVKYEFYIEYGKNEQKMIVSTLGYIVETEPDLAELAKTYLSKLA